MKEVATMGSAIEFLKTSFLHVMPILLAGGFAAVIIFERVKILFKTYPLADAQAFFDKINEMVMAGRLGDAIAYCDRYPAKPTAIVAKQALLRAHQPDSLIENGLQLAVSEVTQAIQKRTSFLAMIANVATLLGLFGTIAGLISSFQAVGHADAQQKSALLAAGISQAMNATMLGLGVAIPCMIAFSFLMNRTNRLVADVEHAAVRTLDMLKQRFYAAESESLNARNDKGGDETLSDDDYAEEAAKEQKKVAAVRRAA